MSPSGVKVPCPSCGDEMPEERLHIEIAHGVCAPCNAMNLGSEYAQPCYGFKNNGATLVKTETLAAHAENVKVVG